MDDQVGLDRGFGDAFRRKENGLESDALGRAMSLTGEFPTKTQSSGMMFSRVSASTARRKGVRSGLATPRSNEKKTNSGSKRDS